MQRAFGRVRTQCVRRQQSPLKLQTRDCSAYGAFSLLISAIMRAADLSVRTLVRRPRGQRPRISCKRPWALYLAHVALDCYCVVTAAEPHAAHPSKYIAATTKQQYYYFSPVKFNYPRGIIA